MLVGGLRAQAADVEVGLAQLDLLAGAVRAGVRAAGRASRRVAARVLSERRGAQVTPLAGTGAGSVRETAHTGHTTGRHRRMFCREAAHTGHTQVTPLAGTGAGSAERRVTQVTPLAGTGAGSVPRGVTH